MPRVVRSRVVETPPGEVWALVSDPHGLPRWWPRTSRVEAVRALEDGPGSRWTKVLATPRGSSVRADYRCASTTEGERYVWEQELEGTPFERLLRVNRVEIHLAPAGSGTDVTLVNEQALRGVSRLGGPMAARAARRTLDEALRGIERALVGDPGSVGLGAA